MEERAEPTTTQNGDRLISLAEAKNIALAELARRRRRLGSLTAEQEMGLEHLLMSTATRICDEVQQYWSPGPPPAGS
jgi:hypothetical protein